MSEVRILGVSDTRTRDEFAAAALSGIIATCKGDNRAHGVALADHFALKAYEVAAAMMARRETLIEAEAEEGARVLGSWIAEQST